MEESADPQAPVRALRLPRDNMGVPHGATPTNAHTRPHLEDALHHALDGMRVVWLHVEWVASVEQDVEEDAAAPHVGRLTVVGALRDDHLGRHILGRPCSRGSECVREFACECACASTCMSAACAQKRLGATGCQTGGKATNM